MNAKPLVRTIAAALIGISISISNGDSAFTAIPCIENTPIEGQEGGVHPITPGSDALPDFLADPEGSASPALMATPIGAGDVYPSFEGAESATENLFRCVTNSDVLVTLMTPAYRYKHLQTAWLDGSSSVVDTNFSSRLTAMSAPWATADGDAAISFEALYTHDSGEPTLLTGTLIWTLIDEDLYLDESAIDLQAPLTHDERLRFHHEGIQETHYTFGEDDVVLITMENQTEDVSSRWTLTSDTTDTLPLQTSGVVMPYGMPGGRDDALLFLHDLDPGTYTLTIEVEDGPTYDVSIDVLAK